MLPGYRKAAVSRSPDNPDRSRAGRAGRPGTEPLPSTDSRKRHPPRRRSSNKRGRRRDHRAPKRRTPARRSARQRPRIVTEKRNLRRRGACQHAIAFEAPLRRRSSFLDDERRRRRPCRDSGNSLAPGKTMTDYIPIRVLIVDDEPLARKRLRELLKDAHEIAVVGECANGAETI